MRLAIFLKKRSVQLALTLAAALSIIAAGTFAWFSLIQSTTNDFVYEPADLRLVKYEAGTELPLAGAFFDLFDENNNHIGRYVTDESGSITVNGLDGSKQYYFKEIKAPYGYSIPEKATTDLVGTGGETLVVYNTPISASLSIVKHIGSADLNGEPYTPTPEDLAFPFAFKVTIGTDAQAGYHYEIMGADGNRIAPYDYTYQEGPQAGETVHVSGQGTVHSGQTVYLRHGETAVIEGISALTYYKVTEQNYMELTYDEEALSEDDFGCDGEHKHTKEIGVASGWAGYGDNTFGNLREEGSVAAFENRRVPENYKITVASLVIVDRILAHPEDIDPEKGFSVTVTVGEDPEQTYWYEVIHPEPIEAVLPDYSGAYEYYQRNDPGVPEPLKPQEVPGMTGRSGLVLPEVPGSYAAKLPFHRPSDYERWRQTDGTLQELSLSQGNVITAELHHGSAVIIYGIPTGTRYTAEQVDYRYIDGYMIDSTVKTEGVILPDLEALEDPDTDDPLLLRVRGDIYNYFIRPIMRTITITKQWDHTGNSGQRPDSTVVDVIDVDTGLQFDSRTLIKMEDWLASVTVPKYDPETGEEIDFGVTEHLPPDYVLGKLEPTEDGFTLTNTYAPATVKPGVRKVIEGDNPPGDGSFTFEIKAVTAGAPMPVGGNTVSIRGEGTAFFGDILFDKTGTYSYRIWERSGGRKDYRYDTSAYVMTVVVTDDGPGNLTAAASYSKSGHSAASPLVFRNQYTAQEMPVEYGSLTVTKRVTGENADKTRKFDFTVELGGIRYRIALADGERYTFTEIPVGTKYNVTEEKTVGYAASSSGSSGVIVKGGSTADFLNTADVSPDIERGSLVVKKTVTGSFVNTTKRFRFVVRIGTVEYELYLRHGEQKTFEGLPVGTEYAVVEDNYTAQGYRTSGVNAAGKITAGTTVAAFENHYEASTPPPPGEDAVQIGGQKTWVHGSNPEVDWPQAITVYVLDGSVIVAQKQVTAAEDWRYTFELPKYDAAGDPIEYSVSEAPVAHYAATILGHSITNTYTGDVESPGPDAIPSTGDTPKTGDSGDLRFWMLTLLAATAALWRVVFYWKPEKKQ